MQEIITTAGQKQTLTLPDGSTLVVNACSHVRYPQSFAKDNRQIYLEGEAYFQVAPNKNHPFIITTSKFDIKVLGTSFNVKAYPEDENNSVTVESGKVQIDLPEAMLRLSGQEELAFNTVTEEFYKQRKEGEVSPWVKGGLRFTRTPIRDVARELERFYNCHITFNQGQEFNNLISGEHENSSLEAVLRSIEYITGIRYTITGNQIFLYK
ncbi:MAG: FecR domain-containing protein [Bacteroides sp.]|nr:FecR domain-containing protein [Bacteroides sp.]